MSEPSLFEYAQRYFTSTRCPDFADSKPQRENRPLKADGQAGIITKHLLLMAYASVEVGGTVRYSVQDIIGVLDGYGITSNCPDRRLREAVKWLEREGCTVHKEWIEGKTRYMTWRVEWNDAAQKAMNKLKV
jgi:hypothetical protein